MVRPQGAAGSLDGGVMLQRGVVLQDTPAAILDHHPAHRPPSTDHRVGALSVYGDESL